MGDLWFGGHIYTMQHEGDAVEAVYTERDKIIAVGTYEKLYHTYFKSIENEINLQGKTMLPGLIDSHLHILMHGEKLLRLDLSQLKSAEEVKETLRNRTANLSENEWLIGEGWNENQWDDPIIIHKSELDEICPNNPVMLTRVCRHALLANSYAINLSNVKEDTPDPQGGIIVRDEHDEITGYFLDTAQDLIKRSLPSVSKDYLQKVIEIAVDDLVSKGVVGGHSEDLSYYGSFDKTYRAFIDAIDGVNTRFKAHLLVHHEVLQDMFDQNLGWGDGTEYVELGAVKIFADGAIGGRTAWLTEDYSDDPGNYGVAILSLEDLEKVIKKARSHGLPVAVHAIGDRAAEEVLKIINRHPLSNGRRDRLIHGQILNERALELLSKLPVAVDIQPLFVTSDFPWAIDRLGEDRLKLAYAWKTMMDQNVHCAGSSDAPIEEVSPLRGIQAAVLRRASFDGKIYYPNEALSVYQAVHIYTHGGAYAINQESTRGRLIDGYAADFTILEEDIFQVEPDHIQEIDIAMTVIDGKIVYEKNPYY
ncbi:amidohydrolase [Virgibacillus phasianinus]|uniref:Amidohydrolase n=2 Tax=Virgibacillus phasianinus TaxID=2017483 RepID=A0A220U4A8_9BACI|nr:amidohydrolase [Virgibacillus phasianinus]ASK62947.1 amidohydrolase [Virgibacillus phasianinus]